MTRAARIQNWIDRAVQQVRDAVAAGETSVLLDGSFEAEGMLEHWVWAASNDVTAELTAQGKRAQLVIKDCDQQPGQKRISLEWSDR